MYGTSKPIRTHNINKKPLLSCGLPLNKSRRKAFGLFCGITILVFCIGYLRRGTAILNNSNTGSHDRPHSRNIKETVKNMQRTGKKIFMAFNYWEQLTMATNNLFDLTALAVYGGRQVVMPLVNDSKFHGSPKERGFETLALYYNVTALNRSLRARGHSTLISWKEFQDVCQGKLDVLVHLDYTKIKKTRAHSQTMKPFSPCNTSQWNIYTDFKVKRTVCMNVFAVDSVEKFENEVVKRLPCVGFDKWKGSKHRNRFRAQFQLSPFVTHRMRSGDAAVFFNSKLLHVAQDFIARNLGPLFISVHIRAERILSTFKNISRVRKCISNLSALVQRHKNVRTAHIPVFLAADFADYGSSSRQVKPARENAKSLMKILAPLKPVIFQPSAYNLTDRGAVAIVEMNILVSAKHLFVVGGGKFQRWIVDQFLNKNSINQRSKVKCRSKLCYGFCYF